MTRRERQRAGLTLGRDNKDHYRPITYGPPTSRPSCSCRGRVDARTILTYSQSENPRSPWSSDQTRMFSQERWSGSPWTDAQIAHDLVTRFTVTGWITSSSDVPRAREVRATSSSDVLGRSYDVAVGATGLVDAAAGAGEVMRGGGRGDRLV